MLAANRVDDEKEVYNIMVSRRVLESLTPQEIRDLKLVFDAFDVNSDGFVDLSSLVHASEPLCNSLLIEKVSLNSMFLFLCWYYIISSLLPMVDVRRSLLSLGFKVSKGEVRNLIADADLGATNG